MLIHILPTLVLLLLIVLLLAKWNFLQLNEFPRYAPFLAFFTKLLAAYGIWAIYSYYYTDRSTADIFKYFDDASYLFDATRDKLSMRWELIFGLENRNDEMNQLLTGTKYWDRASTWYFNDNRTMIRIHLLLLHLSYGFFHFHLLFFAFISFIGSLGLYRFFTAFSQINKKLIFLFVMFVPSVLFWCSAPLKESWLLLGMGLFLYGLSKSLTNQKNDWLSLTFGVLILLSIKIYILLALLPSLLFVAVYIVFRKIKFKYSFLLSCLLFSFIFLIYANSAIPILSQKLLEFKILATNTNANSSIEMTSYSGLSGMLSSLPNALYNVFIKPSFPINYNLFGIMSAIENSMLLALITLPIIFYKKPEKTATMLALFCFSFILVCTSVIGLTCPIIGAIVRYKAPLLPFYLILLFTFVDFKRINRFLKL